MQQVKSRIGVGSRLVFVQYTDVLAMPVEDRILPPGQFLVVAAINEDGGLQCFPTDEHGKITSLEGDTVFPEEVTHLTYCAKADVRVVVG